MGPFLPQGVFYSSSSSSILGFVSVLLVGVVAAGWLPEMTESRAALILCVAAYLSVFADWSMLGRCLLRGLPTKASAGTSAGARDKGPGVAVLAVFSCVEGSPVVPCDVSGVEFLSGSTECARLSFF